VDDTLEDYKNVQRQVETRYSKGARSRFGKIQIDLSLSKYFCVD
jgi:hypothetical protein